MDDHGLTEFPVGPREICDFERNLTSIYRTSAFARERRLKNVIQSITWCKDKSGLQHEYLVIQIRNHKDDGSTYLKLERTRNPTDSTATLAMASPNVEKWRDGRVPAKTRGRPSLTLIHPSATSIRSSKSYFGTNLAHDVIELFDGHPRPSDQTFRDIQFQNTQFTLYSLTVIAKVVHDAREKYHIQEAQCYWFAATVLGVATIAYDGTTIENSPSGSKLGTLRGIKILDVFWGADVKMEVERALELVKDSIAEREQMISEAANPEVAIAKANANAQVFEQQAKKQMEQAILEAEEAKRETKMKDAEIRRLQQLLAESGSRGANHV